MKKKILKLITLTTLGIFCLGLVSGCNNEKSTTDNSSASDNQNNSTETPSGIAEITDKDKQTDYDKDEAVNITLNGNSIDCNDTSVSVNDSTATISAKGTYVISGTLNDGQIIVNVSKNDDVHLILNNADITCKDSAPIYIQSADKTIITLLEGTNNVLSDGPDFTFTDSTAEEPNATLFSKDSLTINGSGSLTVNAVFNNGIQTKDHLKILGGNITVDCDNDALKGKDSVTITAGTFNLIAGGDGINSSNADEANMGYINITGGDITIDSAGKGINAESLIYIQGGTCEIEAIDDSINCNGSFKMDNGALTLTTKDDAIRADISITINDGTVDIKDCNQDYNSENVVIK